MNLSKLGLSAMLAAQHRLNTTGHNINNADTDGYNRQTVLSATAGATATGAGYVGRGVQAVTVQRAYDSFLQRQLVAAQTKGAELVSYGNEITQINNLFADPGVGIGPALKDFFAGMQAVASEPGDPAARQELLGRAASLVGQVNDTSNFLQEQYNNVNTQIHTVVSQVNSHLERIHELNRQVTAARAATTGHEPNDLLDQRDQLVAELSQLVGVKVIEQDGLVNLTVGNGQVLLGGDTVFPLQAVPSAADPSRVVVAYTAQVGGVTQSMEMREESIKGGQLGGLIAYRREALDSVQNDIGRLAVGLAMAFNAQHTQGADLQGNPGGDFFSLGSIVVRQGEHNAAGTHDIGATFVDANALSGQDYRITFDGAAYTVTRVPDGTTFNLNDGDTIDGVQFNFTSGTAAAGDSWLVQPTRDAARNLSLVISDPAHIAAAAAGAGRADGENARALAKLQTDKVLGGGSMSLTEAFSQVVNKVGVLTQKNATAAKAQSSLIAQNYAAQQAVSGVNLNEEQLNLDRYLEQFRAASRMIDVSTQLFDTLLSLRA